LYSQALRIAPRWAEGWWQTGTIHYALNRYAQCRDAFRKFVALQPKLSAGFGFLGLCEFQTKEFPRSTASLERSVELGLPQDEQLTDVVLYHLALVHTKGGNFERALQICAMLAKKSIPDQNVASVAGIAALRRPLFPHELPEADRDAASRLGRLLLEVGARPAAEITVAFEELLKDYPKLPSLRYTYATFLLPNAPDQGVEQLKAELEISPEHLPALISLAFEYLGRGKPELALPYAEKAAKIAPGSFAARACLGRVLLEAGEQHLAAATRELEMAARLAPDSPQIRFSLASAYARAGRKADAAREREEFARLKQVIDAGKPPAGAR
jgi:tetratricopeptide (TPR) repeat protein